MEECVQEQETPHLIINDNRVSICKDIFVNVLQPSHGNNEIPVLEACKLVDVVVAVASVVHRAQCVSIDVLSPFLCMVNLRYNPTRWNHWVAMDLITN